MQTSLLGKHRFNAIFDIFQLACNGSTHFNLVCDWFVLFLRPQHEQNECVCLLSAIDYISYIIVPFVLLAIILNSLVFCLVYACGTQFRNAVEREGVIHSKAVLLIVVWFLMLILNFLLYCCRYRCCCLYFFSSQFRQHFIWLQMQN